MKHVFKFGLIISHKQILIALIVSAIFVSLEPYQTADSLGFFFNSIINVSNTPDNFSSEVKIAISGSNVHVVWSDSNFFNNDVFYAKSTDGGLSFGTPVNLSNNTGASSLPQISVSGNNVYVIWADNSAGPTEIFWSRSTDGGTTFNGSLDPNNPGVPINLSNSVVDSSVPQMAVSGSNIYLAWVDDSGSFGEIFFTKSIDDGVNFAVPLNLSNTTSGNSIQPRISVSGNNVSVVWDDNDAGNEEIYFSQSTDGGIAFNGSIDPNNPGPPVNLSNNSGLSQLPKIAMSGTNLFVVWQDFTPGNDDIFYTKSNDGGITFNGGSPGDPINLSDNLDLSGSPEIGINGTNVYVVWHDVTPGNAEIFFRSSSDDGENFNTVKNLSSNSGDSLFPRIATSGQNVYVVWQDLTPLNFDVFFKASGDNGTNFGGSVNLSNDSFDSGFDVELGMDGSDAFVVWPNDGPFGYDIFFNKGSQSSIDIVYDASEYKLTDTANITINAPDFNLDSGLAETIPVTVTSTTDPVGINIIVQETDVDTGVFIGSHNFTINPSSSPDLQVDIGDTITATFGGQTGTATIFPRDIAFTLNGYNLISTATITVVDQNANTDNLTAQTISVTVTSTTDPVGILLVLSETGVNTGSFTGSLTFSTDVSAGTVLKVAEGDTITASYFDKTGSALIIPGFVPGGSGGGLVIKPGLVLDLLALNPSLSILGNNTASDTDKIIMPSHDTSIDFPLTIDGDGFALTSYSNIISTRTKTVGEPVKVQLVVRDFNEIQHVAFYTDLRGENREIENSDAYVVYDKNNPLQVVDPNNIFSNVNVSTSRDGQKNTFVFEFTFNKPMEKSDIILRAWDNNHSSSDAKILDAWQIVEPSENLQNKIPTPELPSQNTTQGIVQDDQNHFIEMWGGFSSESISDTKLLDEFGIAGDHIPSWFKANAKWILDGDVTKQEFVEAIKYLHKVGIIK